MFTCRTCKEEFDDALRALPNLQCRPCKNAYLRQWQDRNREHARQAVRNYQAAHRDEVRAMQADYRKRPENREIARQRTREWYGKNKERAAEVAKLYAERRRPMAAARHKKRMQADPEYAAKHRLHMRICRAKRRAAEAAGIAMHYVKQIKEIYAACPPGMEVDHIHPLLGENFSGLHVPWNLQYLPMPENRAKRNKLLEV